MPETDGERRRLQVVGQQLRVLDQGDGELEPAGGHAPLGEEAALGGLADRQPASVAAARARSSAWALSRS